jgi:GNAT superfamily N-acetyltransferase
MITFRRASVDEILPLRHAELRPLLPVATAHFEGDEDPATRHFGAFEAGVCLGCASFMLNEFEGTPAYQLRGMATRRDRQGQGLGAKLLSEAAATIGAQTGVTLLWCNAREAAVGFYEKQGWRVVGEKFDVPTVGAHYRMVKK